MKFLFQPIKPFIISQDFGEDKVCFNGAGNLINKQTFASCPVGFTSLYHKTNGHNGLDLIAKRWQPVYAAAGGVVQEIQTEVERGLGCGIVTQVGDKYYKHRYWHFIALDCYVGEIVKTGDLIGYVDSTGYSTGDHLHFELKECTKSGATLNIGNGHLGAIDPKPYLFDTFACDEQGKIKQLTEIIAKLSTILADLLRRKTH